MIFVTGDTHGDFTALTRFAAETPLTRGDYVLICGDFGGVWSGDKKERRRLDRLEALPCTVLFVDGNHENFDRLEKLPVEEWQGGKIHAVRPHVLHLMRGQVFQIDGHTLFTMGGAASHDISDGILSPSDVDYEENRAAMRSSGMKFRTLHRDWWPRELPSPAEYEQARRVLASINWKVDYIVTHCAPTSLQTDMNPREFTPDALTDFLEEVREKLDFRGWYFGHYHEDRDFSGGFHLLYHRFIPIF